MLRQLILKQLPYTSLVTSLMISSARERETPWESAKRNGLHPNTVIQIKKLLIEKFKNSPMRIKRINEFVLTRHLSP